MAPSVRSLPAPKTTRASLALPLMLGGLVCMLALPREATAITIVDLVWTATTGSGVTGSSSIDAANGDTLTAEIRVTADAAGIDAIALSLRFDASFDDELNLISATETCTVATCGGMTPITAGVLGTVESTLASAGSVLTMEAGTFGTGPSSTTFTLGSVVFQVNNLADDGVDVVGFFNLPIDGVVDNAQNYSAAAIFNGASVIPEPGTGLLVMNGLLGLAYRQWRHGREARGRGSYSPASADELLASSLFFAVATGRSASGACTITCVAVALPATFPSSRVRTTST